MNGVMLEETQTIWFIRKTYRCNIYRLIPHFYIVKLGYAGVYQFLQNIDCGYSLERVPTIYVVSNKNVFQIPLDSILSESNDGI